MSSKDHGGGPPPQSSSQRMEEEEDEEAKFERLLQKFSPVVKFDKDEEHYPISYEKLLQGSNLYYWAKDIYPLKPDWELAKAGMTADEMKSVVKTKDDHKTRWKLRPHPQVRGHMVVVVVVRAVSTIV